jgi:putative DNA primase/helicase
VTDRSGDAAPGGGSSPGKPTWVGRATQGDYERNESLVSPTAIEEANGHAYALSDHLVDEIQILKALGRLTLAKTWLSDGSIRPYDEAKNFTETRVSVSDIWQLRDLLEVLRTKKNRCVIRGRSIGHECIREAGAEVSDGCVLRQKAFIEDCPLHAVMFDSDKYRPDGIDPIAEPAAAVSQWVERKLPPEFQGVSYYWHLSNSAGHPTKTGVLRVHVWFWLHDPLTSSQVQAWAESHSIEVDCSLFQSQQPHYTADPTFEEGVVDPVPVRAGFFEGHSDEVYLTWAAKPETEPARPTPKARRIEDAEWDSVADYILKNGLSRGPEDGEGRIPVDCPRGDKHMTDSGPTSTVWLRAGTSGFEHGHFKCLHESCGKPSEKEFLRHIGFLLDFKNFTSNGKRFFVQPPPKSAPADGVCLVSGADIQPKPVPWLWKHWLSRGALHLFAGEPSTGKTTVALALAAALTRGAPWPDRTPSEPSDVLIWSGEDSIEHTLVPRLIAAGADMKRIHFVTVTIERGKPRPFDPGTDMEGLMHAAAAIPNIAMMLVDPVVVAVKGDSHKNAETRRGLQPLIDLGTALNAVVLGITHFAKNSSGRDPVERVIGSIAFGAVARSVMAFAKRVAEKGGGRIMVRAKNSLGPDGDGFAYDLQVINKNQPDEVTRVEWTEFLKGSPGRLLLEAEGKLKSQDAGPWLLQRLREGPVLATVALKEGEALGYSEGQLKRARKEFGITSRKHGMDGPWYWCLPMQKLPEVLDEGGDFPNASCSPSSPSSGEPPPFPSETAPFEGGEEGEAGEGGEEGEGDTHDATPQSSSDPL